MLCSAVFWRMVRIWSGVRLGFACLMRATQPTACGQAMLVPLSTLYSVPSVVGSPLADTMPAPGVTTLGFISSVLSASPLSARGPSLENDVTVSSLRSSVVLCDVAPTAIDVLAPAGLEMLFWRPSLPVAMHTAIPWPVAASTISSSGSLPSELHITQPSDMFSTWTPRYCVESTPGHAAFA